MTGAKSVWPIGRRPAVVIARTAGRRGHVVAERPIVRLLEYPRREPRPHQLVGVGVGGSATAPAIIQLAEERFPHLTGTMSSGYGSTETGLLSFAPNWMLRVAPVASDRDSGRVDPYHRRPRRRRARWGGRARGQELAVDAGYWRTTRRTPRRSSGRWIRTGDFGRLEHGVLYIASRLRDLSSAAVGTSTRSRSSTASINTRCDRGRVYGSTHAVRPSGDGRRRLSPVRRSPPTQSRAFCAETLLQVQSPGGRRDPHGTPPRTATGRVMKQVLSGGPKRLRRGCQYQITATRAPPSRGPCRSQGLHLRIRLIRSYSMRQED